MLQITFVPQQQARVVARQFQFRQLFQNPLSLVKTFAIHNRINYEKGVRPIGDLIVTVAVLFGTI